MNQEIFSAVDHYISDLFSLQDDILLATEQSIIDAGMPQISISANQGKFLQMLATLCNANKILEIGTLGGYSTIWLARALQENGKLITLELEPAHAAVAEQNIIRAHFADKVEIKVGNALDMLPQLQNETPFDMIFIDADKPSYSAYFDWAVKLARPGALIIADNVIRDGKVLDQNTNDERVIAVQQFNQMLANRKDVIANIIQTVGIKEYDGMAIAIVK